MITTRFVDGLEVLCCEPNTGPRRPTPLLFVHGAFAGAWMWYGLTRLIGAHDLVTWQVLADVISFFIGSPSDLDGGVLLDAVRVALLAAVLETAVATADGPQPRSVSSAAR